MSWLGSQPADKKVFQSLIDKGSVAVVVGGIAEMFMQYDDKEQVCWFAASSEFNMFKLLYMYKGFKLNISIVLIFRSHQ